MRKQYQSSPRSARIAAAVAAVLTALMLFDFVSTLGESAETVAVVDVSVPVNDSVAVARHPINAA